jgi:hypothetical protein
MESRTITANTYRPAFGAQPRSVDGFVRQPSGGLRQKAPQPATPRRPTEIRSIAPRPPRTPQQAAPGRGRTDTEAPRLPAQRVYTKPPAIKQRRLRIPERVQLPLIIMCAMGMGIFVQDALFGQLAIAVYGIAAFIWRIASRTTFTLALLSLVATTLLLVARGNIPMAQNFATYTFLLLVVGVITLSRELRQEGGRIYSRRKYYN